MKKFVLILLLILFCTGQTLADTRYYTKRNGVRTMYGYIPTNTYGAYTSCDPFILTVGGEKYYMVVDKRGEAYTYKSLLGCNYPNKHSLHAPLEALNKDCDSEKLTPRELRLARIRFVKLKANGRLALYERDLDYDIDNIGYIDLRRVRFSTTATPYGNFDVYIKRDSGSLKKVVAKVTAHSIYKAEKMFN